MKKPHLQFKVSIDSEDKDWFVESDVAAQPFFAAIGRAFSRWQDVELALFLTVHATLRASAEVSSVVYFNVRGQENRAQLSDRLWRINLPDEAKTEWNSIFKRVIRGLQVRNKFAHFETAWIRAGSSPYGDAKPPVVLVPHHMDFAAWRKPKHTAFTTEEITSIGSNWHKLMLDILRHVSRRYRLAELHLESLPPEFVRILSRMQDVPPEQRMQHQSPNPENEETT